MASNFYEAGLSYLLKDVSGVFDERELAVLRWLHASAETSAATYWDAISQHPEFWVVIDTIVIKCRHLRLHDVFERFKEQYADKRRAA